MEWAGAVATFLKVTALVLYLGLYWMGKRAGIRKGRELQRIDDERELQEYKTRLANLLYDSSSDPNAGLGVLQKPESIRKLP